MDCYFSYWWDSKLYLPDTSWVLLVSWRLGCQITWNPKFFQVSFQQLQELQSTCRDHFITLHVCHSQVTKEKNGIISLQVRDIIRWYHMTRDSRSNCMTYCLFVSLNVFPEILQRILLKVLSPNIHSQVQPYVIKRHKMISVLELIWYVHLEILTSDCRVAVEWGY